MTTIARARSFLGLKVKPNSPNMVIALSSSLSFSANTYHKLLQKIPVPLIKTIQKDI